jgi:hypothetical protein
MARLQLRLARPVRGSLVMRDVGGEIWRQRLDGLPERRILVPLAGFIDRISGDTLTLSIDETA